MSLRKFTAHLGIYSALFALGSLSVSNAAAADIYEATDGYVVMEAESASLVSGWVEHEPEVNGARNQAIRFTEGASICSTNANQAADFDALEYHFRVSEAGKYWVKMNIFKQAHCVDIGTDGASCHSGAGCQSYGVESDGDSCNGADRCWRRDISNDVYVAVQDAQGQGVPFSSGSESDTQIMKFFGGSDSAYAWSGNGALDHKEPSYNLQPGDYVLLVRGRSRGASLDRVIVYLDGADQGAAKLAPTSEIVVQEEPGDGSGGGATQSGSGGESMNSSGEPTDGGETSGEGNRSDEGSGNLGGESSGSNGGSGDSSGCSFTAGQQNHSALPWLTLLSTLGAAFFFRRRRLEQRG